MRVELKTVRDTIRFVNKCNNIAIPIYVRAGSQKVNAKSIMNLFSLDLGGVLEIIVDTNSEEEERSTEKALLEFKPRDL